MSSRLSIIGPTPLRFNTLLLVLFGLFCLGSYAQQQASGQAAPTAQSTLQPAFDQPPTTRNPLCRQINTVAPAECDVLVALYQDTNGAQWDDRTNWLTPTSPNAPCDWYGVVCSGGHVTALHLNSNRLRGPLPRSIGELTHLVQLRLDDNQMRGPVSPSLCDLADTLQTARFDYNQLSTGERRGKECLDHLQPTWSATQTTPPRDLRITAVTTTSLQLSWTPIPYVADGGYYRISYAAGLANNFVIHGQTADKQADRYVLTNLQPGQPYRIRIQSYTPAHAQQENEQLSQPTEIAGVTQSSTTERVLLLLYFAADNDLSPYIPMVLQRLERGTRANPNVQVVALTDGRGDHNTSLVEIANGRTTVTNRVVEQWGVDELDTADPQVLTWFLQSGRQRYPASRTLVSLLGHGSGLMPEVTSPAAQHAIAASATPPPAIPALPRTVPHTPDDITDDSLGLSTQDYAQALAAATNNGADPFDVVFFDQCFQGNLDVLYELRRAARIFIASPNYAWLSAPYDQYLAIFTPTATPEQLADAMIQIYDESLRARDGQNHDYPYSIFWVRGADLSAIASAVDALATPLQAAMLVGAENLILQAANTSQSVDTSGCGRETLPANNPAELVGVGSFARNLRARFLGRDPYGVIPAAEQLLTQLAQVQGLAATGHPYLAPQQNWNYTDTLTMLAPLARANPGDHNWRTTIYTSSAPLRAVWATTLPETVLLPTALAATQEGGWDDFLAAWYTAPLTPTIGAGCNYTPPVQRTSEVTETLALTLTAADNLLHLQWTPTSNDDASSYWLLVRKPDGYGWVVQESFPLAQTTYQVQKPTVTGAPYEFMVSAQDATGLIVAQSNQASYGAATLTDRLFLPLVGR